MQICWRFGKMGTKMILIVGTSAIIGGGLFIKENITFEVEKVKYKRSLYRHWIDADKDCQNTRQEVLIEESLTPVVMDERGCKVVRGKWYGLYTGEYYYDPKMLDIDHMVPLKHTHNSGGYKWDKQRKKEYANYLTNPINLIAVYRGANRSKGARGPDEWMPKNREYWCQYLLDWVDVKIEWNLDASPKELDFIKMNLRSEKCSN